METWMWIAAVAAVIAGVALLALIIHLLVQRHRRKTTVFRGKKNRYKNRIGKKTKF